MKTGRPSSFRHDTPAIIERIVSNGDTMKKVACRLGVCVPTLHRWAKQYPAVRYAIADGRQAADLRLSLSLPDKYTAETAARYDAIKQSLYQCIGELDKRVIALRSGKQLTPSVKSRLFDVLGQINEALKHYDALP